MATWFWYNIAGAAIQFSTVIGGVLACCIQSVFKKSVISLAGATQALGGECFCYTSYRDYRNKLQF